MCWEWGDVCVQHISNYGSYCILVNIVTAYKSTQNKTEVIPWIWIPVMCGNWIVPAHESRLCMYLSNSTFINFKLVAWNWPWWEYLHHGDQQMPPIRALLLPWHPKPVIRLSIYLPNTSLSSVQSLSHVWLFATPWIAARQASLSITNSWSLPKTMSIESVMPSNHLILYRTLLLLPSIFPSIRVFLNESALCIRWP